MKEKILLTGATGFLGSHILRKLIEVGEDVVVLARENSNFDRINNLKEFSIFIVNQHFSNIENLYQKYSISTIIHVATEYGRDSNYSSVLMSNVLFPIKLYEFADKKKLKLFINTDSFSCKFPNSSYLKDYISSKILFKNYLKSQTQVQVINLQLEHIYGNFDSKGKFVTFLIESMLKNEKTISLTAGEQKRDFIYVSDVVDAYMCVLKNKHILSRYEEFEVGNGVSISIREFVSKIHSIMNSKSSLLFGALETRVDEIKDSKANNKKLISLGWEPKFNLDNGLKALLNNY